MKDDHYIHVIEELLRQIPELERSLSQVAAESERQRLARSLRHREKRLERMIPFQFRRQLHNMCQQVGVRGNFI